MDDDFAAELQNIEQEIARGKIEQQQQQQQLFGGFGGTSGSSAGLGDVNNAPSGFGGNPNHSGMIPGAPQGTGGFIPSHQGGVNPFHTGAPSLNNPAAGAAGAASNAQPQQGPGSSGMSPFASAFTPSSASGFMTSNSNASYPMNNNNNINTANLSGHHMNPATAAAGGAQGATGFPAPQQAGAPNGPPQHTFSKDSDERSIFVGNLPKNVPVTPEELIQFFSECGPILNCTILKDRVTHEPKGTAYIEFGSYASMGKAIDGMNNAQFKGSTIMVTKKRSNFRPDRARGRGRGIGGVGAVADPYQAIAAIMGLMGGVVPTGAGGAGAGAAAGGYRGGRGGGRGRGRPNSF